MKDYYAILDIPIDAPQEKIREQYLFLVHAWHPDKFPTPAQKLKAEEKIKEINAAYDVLSNLTKRTQYNRERSANHSGDNKKENNYRQREEDDARRHAEQAYQDQVKRQYEQQQREQAESAGRQAEQERQQREWAERQRQQAEYEATRKRQAQQDERQRLFNAKRNLPIILFLSLFILVGGSVYFYGKREMTQQALQKVRKGTLIFLQDDTIHVQESDGADFLVSPLSNKSSYADYDTHLYSSMEIAPNRNGFYFAASKGNFEPAIFYSNLDGTSLRLLKQFTTQSFISGIAVSPDNTKLAVIVNSFVNVPDQIWIIPTNGGEGDIVWESTDDSALGSAWAHDSNSIYAYIEMDTYTYIEIQNTHILNLKLNGNSTSIANWGTKDDGWDDFTPQPISISSDGKDIVIGKGTLGILRFNDKKKSILSDIAPVCNPIYTQDKKSIVFATGNKIMVFDIASGKMINPISLSSVDMDYSGCPASFDWEP